MNTYEFAEMLYNQLDNRNTYENLIKVMEIYPDEFIQMMKEVYDKQDPAKSSKIEILAKQILGIIKDAITFEGVHNYDSIIGYVSYETRDLHDKLKDLSPSEINDLVNLTTLNDEFDGYQFHVFRNAFMELRYTHQYSRYDELDDIIRNTDNMSISPEDIETMLD